jgi:hypothetical protein
MENLSPLSSYFHLSIEKSRIQAKINSLLFLCFRPVTPSVLIVGRNKEDCEAELKIDFQEDFFFNQFSPSSWFIFYQIG